MNVVLAPRHDTEPVRLSGTGLLVVVALHGAVLWGLIRLPSARPIPAAAVLSVSLLPAAIPSPALEPAPPVPPPPRPAPRERTPLAVPAEAPAAATTAPTEFPVPAAPSTPVPSAPAAAPAPAAPPAPTPPRFDADYLDNPKPAYPSLARRLGEEGRVLLRVRVAADGLPAEVALQAGSGSPRLDQAALDTVRRWKFAPARLGGEPVAATVLVPIVFSLKD